MIEVSYISRTGAILRRLILLADIEQVIERSDGETLLIFKQKRRKIFKTYHRQMCVLNSYECIKSRIEEKERRYEK